MATARFPTEASAGAAYLAAQAALYTAPEADVSVFRLQLNRVWHVAALGEQPPANLADQLTAILAAGEPVSLPTAVLAELARRRAQAMRQAPWVERHLRPIPPQEQA
jgi:hypothetical protein